MDAKNPLAQIAEVLKAPANRRFVVMSHLRPDGDAIGCTVAVALLLQALGKEVTAWNHDGPVEKLAFLPGSELVQRPPAGEKLDFDVAIALDTASRERLGDCLASIGHAKTWINIDHHVSNNGYGDLAHIDTQAPAAGQIVYNLIQAGNLPLTPGIADNLFAAISTDTGSFQYSNTTARTFEIAAALVKAGVNVGKISEQLYQSYPRRRLELLRELLNATKYTCGERVASFALTLDAATRLGVTPEDNEGLIDNIRAVESVDVAVFFEELPEGKIRVSMRSKDPRLDVCKICGRFNGGGHTLAAGARIAGDIATVETKVLDAICEAIHAAAP